MPPAQSRWSTRSPVDATGGRCATTRAPSLRRAQNLRRFAARWRRRRGVFLGGSAPLNEDQTRTHLPSSASHLFRPTPHPLGEGQGLPRHRRVVQTHSTRRFGHRGAVPPSRRLGGGGGGPALASTTLADPAPTGLGGAGRPWSLGVLVLRVHRRPARARRRRDATKHHRPSHSAASGGGGSAATGSPPLHPATVERGRRPHRNRRHFTHHDEQRGNGGVTGRVVQGPT